MLSHMYIFHPSFLGGLSGHHQYFTVKNTIFKIETRSTHILVRLPVVRLLRVLSLKCSKQGEGQRGFCNATGGSHRCVLS